MRSVRGASLVCLALAMSISLPAVAQTIAGSKQAQVGQQTVLHTDNYKAPKTSWGVPDLQGLFTNATLTTLERPAQYGDNLVMPPEDAKKIDDGEAKSNADGNKPTDPNAKVTDLPKDCGRGFTGVNCGYNGFWVDPGSHIMNINGEFRTYVPEGRQTPVVELRSFGDPEVFPVGVKHRYTRKR